MEYCMAVKKGETELYSILAKASNLVPEASVNAALSHYITEDARLTIRDFIIDNLAAVLSIAGLLILLILILLILNMRAAKRAKKKAAFDLKAAVPGRA